MRRLFRSFLFFGLVIYFSTALAVVSLIWAPPGWMEDIGTDLPGVVEEGSLGERIEEGGDAEIAEKIEVWTRVMEEKARESMQVFLHPLQNVRQVLRCGNLLIRAGAVFLFLLLFQR